jgi:hypothetical protein
MQGFCRALWRTRTADLLLTMRSKRQRVATHGNGFGLLAWLLALGDLPLIATGCPGWAP